MGSTLEALLVGETGEDAVIAYNDDVTVLKPFDGGDLPSAVRKIAAQGSHARMIDAGLHGIQLLKQRSAARTRVLVFIGQPMDSGSESKLDALRQEAERESVTVYGLALPEAGRAFVSDTFSLQGVSGAERGGFKAGVDLGKLIAVLNRSSHAAEGSDPFSVLTAATGGTQLHFRKQSQLEEAIAARAIG